MATKKFKCNVCGYIHEGETAPDICPICKAPASEFTELKAKGLFSDKNGNPYILLYSTVMVIIVAALLAVASLALQSRQHANILNEKKQAILESLGAVGENYDTFVSAYAVDAEGNKIESVTPDAALQMLFDMKTAVENKTYPVFESQDGRVVLPVNGSGLWGPIWGYVALEKDMDTIVGVVFGHQGETPGLGAEIATPKHWAHYAGKTIFSGDEFVSVVLRKGGAKDPAHEVDAISGGTKTSDGVTAMLRSSLGNYLPLLEAKRLSGAPEVTEPVLDQTAPATQVSNEENVENNE
ncbi:MAG: Na(+)-translocating NADH:ubiquinone reductase subunit C [Alistipes sp.]